MSTSSPGLSKTYGSSEKLKTSRIKRLIYFKIYASMSPYFSMLWSCVCLIHLFTVYSTHLRGQKSSTVVSGNWVSLQMARATWTSSDSLSARLVRTCTCCSYHNTSTLLFIVLSENSLHSSLQQLLTSICNNRLTVQTTIMLILKFLLKQQTVSFTFPNKDIFSVWPYWL